MTATHADLSQRSGLVALAMQVDRLLEQASQCMADSDRIPGNGADEWTTALAGAAAALELAGESGLAALVRQCRTQWLAPAGAACAEELLCSRANHVRAVLREAFDRVLRGHPPTVAELLPVWHALSAPDAIDADDPSPLISLQQQADVELLPVHQSTSPADGSGGSLPEPERVLLEFLRAEDHAARRRSALCLADQVAAIAGGSSTLDAGLYWQVLHAYLLELAEGGIVDAVPAKKLLARLVRALRHREQGTRTLAPLVRQALHAFAGAAPLTEAARRVSRKFRLAQQFAGRAGDAYLPDSAAPLTRAGARKAMLVALDPWLATREMAGDGLGPASDWNMLADIAAQSGLTSLATSLQRIAERLPALQDDAGAACRTVAVMLRLQEWAARDRGGRGAGDDVDSIADLLVWAVEPQAADAARCRDLLIRQCDDHALLRMLSVACRTALDSLERQLEAAAVQGGWDSVSAEADRLLAAVGGAMRLLRLPDLPDGVDELRHSLAALAAAPVPCDSESLERFAQGWVVLAERISLLPWSFDWRADDTASSPPDAETTTRRRLVAVFAGEAACLLARLRQALRDALSGTASTLTSSSATALAVQAAHTLAGCAATVGFPALARLAHALESALERAGDPPWPASFCALLEQVPDRLGQMLAEFMDGGACSNAPELVEALDACVPVSCATPPSDPDSDPTCADTGIGVLVHGDLPMPFATAGDPDNEPAAGPQAGRAASQDSEHDGKRDCELAVAPEVRLLFDPVDIVIAAAADAYPVASVMPAADGPGVREASEAVAGEDDELLALFREELADLLPQLEQALQAWRWAPDDRRAATAILRVLHTLKGSARMAGQFMLGDALHRCEAEVAEIAQLAPSAVVARLDLLQMTVDAWRCDWLGTVTAGTAEASDADAISVAQSTDVAVPVNAAIDAPADGSSDSLRAARPTAPAMPPAAASETARSPGMLRVRTELIDRFADVAAGLWAGHARIVDRVGLQRRTVADVADNLARLNQQLRELEIEADSRILSGAAPAGPAGFDPLELDRYTRLHEITRMIAETAADLTDLQRSLLREADGMASANHVQARELRQLQSELQTLRSQPFGVIDARLRHLLRQAARETGRDIVLIIEGGTAEVERSLLDRLVGPLGHLLRNAAVHGIEPPDERVAVGKPRTGTVTLTVHASVVELQLVLQDDGRGLDTERIRARAIAVGLLRPDEDPAPTALDGLIFQPGFSTASEVTALAGRGIGLDAVSAELRSLGGRISVDSRPGQGCRFSVSVPLSLAALPVLLVRAGVHCIALPSSQLQQVLQASPDGLERVSGAPALQWHDRTLPVQSLRRLLGDASSTVLGEGRVPLAVLASGDRWLALSVDAIDGQREIVVRNPGPQLSQVPGLLGATLLGDGGIAFLVDPFRLQSDNAATELPVTSGVPSDARSRVLVVDDSLTVRRASQRLLERHGYTVMLARDGIDALEQLRDALPAVVLLDIEMPRMDGFELLALMRDDPRLRTLPVVMRTSRIADRHRERARQLGASAYLGKPCPEEELMQLLAGLCTGPRVAA